MNLKLCIGRARTLFLLRWLAHLDGRIARRLFTLGALLGFALYACRHRLVDRLVKLRSQILLAASLNRCMQQATMRSQMSYFFEVFWLVFAFVVIAR